MDWGNAERRAHRRIDLRTGAVAWGRTTAPQAARPTPADGAATPDDAFRRAVTHDSTYSAAAITTRVRMPVAYEADSSSPPTSEPRRFAPKASARNPIARKLS